MDVFELGSLVPNYLPDLIKMKRTTQSLLKNHFEITEKVFNQLGFEHVLKSIVSSSPKPSASGTPLKLSPKKDRAFTDPKKLHFTPETRHTPGNFHMRSSTQFISPIRTRKSIASIRNTPMMTPNRVYDIHTGLKSNSKVPTLNTSFISNNLNVSKDNLFEMGTKRSSRIFNGR